MSDSQGHDSKSSSKKKRIGGVSFLNTKPLIYGIEKNLFPHNFQLTKAIPSALAVELNAKRLDVALIPSIAYEKIAQNSRSFQSVASSLMTRSKASVYISTRT